MNEKLKKAGNYLWKEWIRPLMIIALVMGSMRSALADWNDVPTGSMKPTILEGDRVFINKLAYDLKVPFTTWHIKKWDDPKRGDIVVFYSPADGKRLVKRVIGIPGDTIEMRDEALIVNGVPARYEPIDPKIGNQLEAVERARAELATEKFGSVEHPVMILPDMPAQFASFPPIQVPAGKYFVMGDNRDNSYDSRWIGYIDRQRIIGRAVGVAISVDPARYYKPRWKRFFTGI